MRERERREEHGGTWPSTATWAARAWMTDESMHDTNYVQHLEHARQKLSIARASGASPVADMYPPRASPGQSRRTSSSSSTHGSQLSASTRTASSSGRRRRVAQYPTDDRVEVAAEMAAAMTGSDMLGDEVRFHVAAHKRKLKATAKVVETKVLSLLSTIRSEHSHGAEGSVCLHSQLAASVEKQAAEAAEAAASKVRLQLQASIEQIKRDRKALAKERVELDRQRAAFELDRVEASETAKTVEAEIAAEWSRIKLTGEVAAIFLAQTDALATATDASIATAETAERERTRYEELTALLEQERDAVELSLADTEAKQREANRMVEAAKAEREQAARLLSQAMAIASGHKMPFSQHSSDPALAGAVRAGGTEALGELAAAETALNELVVAVTCPDTAGATHCHIIAAKPLIFADALEIDLPWIPSMVAPSPGRI
eukprot:SAG31_NODE_3532_length_4150_cov_1.181437_1_plen_433_part_00